MLYELILINEIEQRAKIIFLSVCVFTHIIPSFKVIQMLSIILKP